MRGVLDILRLVNLHGWRLSRIRIPQARATLNQSKPTHNIVLHLRSEALALCCFVLAGCSTADQLLYRRGEEEMKQRQYAQAYDTFTRYLELDPGSSGAYYNRALALVGMEKFQPALEDLDTATRLDPTNTDVHWMRFKLESMRRDAIRQDTAVSPTQRPMQRSLESVLTVFMMNDLDAILKIDANDIWALNERGRMKHDQGNFDAAVADYEAALALCDTCTWLMYNEALSLRANWRTREALAVLNTLIATDSLDGEAWLLLGECAFALGRRREACTAFTRSMHLGVAQAEERYNTLCK